MTTPDEKKSILVVDDEPDARDILRFDLERSGFNVVDVGSAKDALDLLEKTEFHAIISDCAMPVMNGLEFLKKVRERDPEKPIFIFCTGHPLLSEKALKQLGALAMFIKPYDPKRLKKILHEHLNPRPQRFTLIPSQKEFPEISVEMEYSGARHSVELENIGPAGMFLRLNNGLPQVGEQVKVYVVVAAENWSPFDGDAEVRWVRKHHGEIPGVGIQFKDMTCAGWDSLARLLAIIMIKACVM